MSRMGAWIARPRSTALRRMPTSNDCRAVTAAYVRPLLPTWVEPPAAVRPSAAMRSVIPSELARVLQACDAAERDDAWTAFVGRYTRLLLHVSRAAIPIAMRRWTPTRPRWSD